MIYRLHVPVHKIHMPIGRYIIDRFYIFSSKSAFQLNVLQNTVISKLNPSIFGLMMCKL